MKTKNVILLLTILSVLGLSSVNAQTTQGQFFIGTSTMFSVAGTGTGDLMSLGFSSINTKSDADGFDGGKADKETGLNLLPKFGFLVIDGLVIGLDLTLALSIEKDGTYDDKYTSTMFGAGPFVRYYIPAQKIKPFVEVGASFGTMKYKYEDGEYSENDYEDKVSMISFLGGIGMAIPIGNKVAFDVMAGYNSITAKEKEDNPDNYRAVVGTIGFKFGFIVFIGGSSGQD